MNSIKPQPIIIDTDPGVDDALAIMFAHASALQVLGITTVFGNQTIEKTTHNACSIVDIIGAETMVYRGMSHPLTKHAPLAKSHGETGLGGYRESGQFRHEITQNKYGSGDAVSFLAEAITPDVQVACLGPTTNLAILANLYPEALRRADNLIIMGGVFGQPGNISPWAEFNVYCDPDAFAQILSFDGVKKVLIPADVCRAVTMDETDFSHLKDRVLSQAIHDIVHEYVEYYKNSHSYGSFAGGVMYDTLIIAYMLWPELFNVEPRHVVVEVGNGLARGATAIDLSRNNQPNCLLVTRNQERMPLGVNSTEVKKRLLQLFT